jgi:diguanylate cyclase (GGDEF)-like protein
MWGYADRLCLPADWPTRIVVLNAIIGLGANLGGVEIVTRLREARARALDLADEDRLTGLLNWRGFERAARTEVEHCRRYGRPLTLAYIDLDNFKEVNDARGHPEGDELLRLVARVLRGGRAADIPARLGGDEFALLLPETDEGHARVVLDRVRGELLAAFAGQGVPVSVSIGAACFAQPPDLEMLLRRADALMYDVKRAGKNAVLTRMEGV